MSMCHKERSKVSHYLKMFLAVIQWHWSKPRLLPLARQQQILRWLKMSPVTNKLSCRETFATLVQMKILLKSELLNHVSMYNTKLSFVLTGPMCIRMYMLQLEHFMMTNLQITVHYQSLIIITKA